MATPKLDEWHIPDGIEILLDKVQDYCDNDFFEVLKRRAENTLSQTRMVLQNLLERYSTGDKFFVRILAHEGFNAEIEVDASENENFLRKVFEENREQICKGASTAVELLPFGKWSKLFMKGE